MVSRWLDPADPAQPLNEFEHACPVAYHYLQGIRNGDGINDWITRKAFIAELDKVRIPMLEVSCTGIDEGAMRDLQAVQAVYCVVYRMGIYGKADGRV